MLLSIDIVFPLHLRNLFLFASSPEFLRLSGRIEVEDNEVTILDIEARKVVTRVLGIVDVFIHDIRRPPCLLRRSQSYLPNGPILAKDVVQIFRRDTERKIPHIERPVYFRR